MVLVLAMLAGIVLLMAAAVREERWLSADLDAAKTTHSYEL
jgi:hypothetical protein